MRKSLLAKFIIFRTGKRKVSEGVAVQSKKDPSVFVYKVSSILPNSFAPGAGVYQVLDTDYKNYAIIWKCTGYGFMYTGKFNLRTTLTLNRNLKEETVDCGLVKPRDIQGVS